VTPERRTRRFDWSRRRWPLLIGMLVGTLALGAASFASVRTDKADYSPGEVVTISGDNSNDAGWLAGEPVHVDVSGPNGYQASCDDVADETGAWSCQVTLWDSELAMGTYAYTATGQLSGVTESGTFTDAINLHSFTSACSTESDSFVTGSTVCMKVTGIPGPSPGKSGTIKWWKPGLNPASDPPTRTFNFSPTTGNQTDTLTVNDCGTWNVRADVDTSPVTTVTDTFAVTGCATNTAPSVAFSSPPTSANEGDLVTFNFAITDSSTDTHSFVSGFPDCGTGNVLVTSPASDAPSIDNTNHTGTFKCRFPDGLVPAVDSTVRVRVQDQGSLTSNIASTDVTVNNVNPTVAQPSFQVTSINCRTSVNLTGISFDDPGADANWAVDIDWGDNSTDTSLTRSITGGVPNQSHQYETPGTYTATVTVTDKDTGQGSNTSSNQLQVLQTYTVDFLPPFDDSTPSGLIVNKMKNGRVVPVKSTIYDDCAQEYVTDPTTNVTIKVTKTSGTGVGDPVEEYADAGQSSSGTNAFRWTSDPSISGGGFWIYNLDSKALGLVVNNLYRVDSYVGAVKATAANWAVLQPVK
jgi:PKD domain